VKEAWHTGDAISDHDIVSGGRGPHGHMKDMKRVVNPTNA